MRKSARGAFAIALASGCASSATLQDRADLHQELADAAAAARHYQIAGDEQRKANEYQKEALDRARDEQRAPGDDRPPGTRLPWPADPYVE